MDLPKLLTASVRVTDAGATYIAEMKKMLQFQVTGKRGGADPLKVQQAFAEFERAVEEAQELREQMLEGTPSSKT